MEESTLSDPPAGSTSHTSGHNTTEVLTEQNQPFDGLDTMSLPESGEVESSSEATERASPSTMRRIRRVLAKHQSKKKMGLETPRKRTALQKEYAQVRKRVKISYKTWYARKCRDQPRIKSDAWGVQYRFVGFRENGRAKYRFLKLKNPKT